MSTIVSRVYENAVVVTPSDTVADPKGPFAGLLVTVAGTLKFTCLGGGVVTLSTTAVGQELHLATRNVWVTGTGATVMGLTSPPYMSRAAVP